MILLLLLSLLLLSLLLLLLLLLVVVVVVVVVVLLLLLLLMIFHFSYCVELFPTPKKTKPPPRRQSISACQSMRSLRSPLQTFACSKEATNPAAIQNGHGVVRFSEFDVLRVRRAQGD